MIAKLIIDFLQEVLKETFPGFAYWLFGTEFLAALVLAGVFLYSLLFREFAMYSVVAILGFILYMAYNVTEFYKYQIKRGQLTREQLVQRIPTMIPIVLVNAMYASFIVALTMVPGAIAVYHFLYSNLGWMEQSVCVVLVGSSLVLSVYVSRRKFDKSYFLRLG